MPKTYKEELKDMQEDPCVRYWVVKAANMLDSHDVCDAINDCATLERLFRKKLKEMK